MKKIYSLCYPFFKKHKFMLVIYVFLSIIVSATSLFTPFIVGSFIDHIISAESIVFFNIYFIAFAFTGSVSLIAAYLSSLIFVKLQTTTGYELNKFMIRHMHHLSLAYLQKENTVYLTQRVNNDSNILVMFFLEFTKNVVINGFMIIIPVFIMFDLNSTLTLLLLIISVFYFVFYMLYKKILYKAKMNFVESQSIFFSKLNEQLFHVKFIKMHAIFGKFINRLDYSFYNLLKNAINNQKAGYIFSSFDKVVLVIAQLIMLFLGGVEIVNNRITIGGFTIIISYFSLMLASTRYFFNLGQSVQETTVACTRLSDILAMDKEINGDIVLSQIKNISLVDFSFKYEGKNIFENLNIEFTMGNVYILAGDNGKGKSTLINNIIGLYINEYSGSIIYNGIDIKKIDLYNLRNKLLGISEQEPILLPDTLDYNLHFDNKYDNTHFLFNVLNMDKYMDNMMNKLGSGVNNAEISGGEKQKISIFRALIKNPDVVILDEPTNSLDVSSKVKLRKYIDSIKHNKIIIIVTHDRDFINKKDDIVLNV